MVVSRRRFWALCIAFDDLVGCLLLVEDLVNREVMEVRD